MKKISASKAVLDLAVNVMGYKHTERFATMKLKDGRMTTHLHIYDTPEGEVILNISDAVTYSFDNKEEFEAFAEKKFKMFASEKELYTKDWGMSEETWDAWNQAE